MTERKSSRSGSNALLLIAGLAVGLLAGYLFFKEKEESLTDIDPHFFDGLATGGLTWAATSTDSAVVNLEKFRKPGAFANLALHWNFKSNCIVHDPGSALSFDTGFFHNFVNTYCPKPGFKWVIGLYPEICLDSATKKPRISIYMIPTMQDTLHKHNIIDFVSTLNSDDSVYYKPGKCQVSLQERRAVTDAPKFIFDQGTIFP